MIKSLHVKNFTVFPEVSFDFANHLNVIVGDNGAGKTHVLKLAYAVLARPARARRGVAGSRGRAALRRAGANSPVLRSGRR
jgi:recombinational DNA repair ATPase RecF